MTTLPELWAAVREDGTVAWQGWIGPNDPAPASEPGTMLVAIDALLAPWERLDRITGQVSIDTEARLAAIDAAYLADHGPDMIRRGRMMKLAEALAYAATRNPAPGLLSAEAELRGVSIAEMASIVIGRASSDGEIELARMRDKAAVRNGTDEPRTSQEPKQ